MGLIGISPLISPELLYTLARMGHGDTIVFADANFPSDGLNRSVIRADGHGVDDLLKAVAPLFLLDTYVNRPVQMMAPVDGDELDPSIEERFREAIEARQPGMFKVQRLERFEFYERAKAAFAVVATGETAKYGNVLLVKGVLGIGPDEEGINQVFRDPASLPAVRSPGEITGTRLTA